MPLVLRAMLFLVDLSEQEISSRVICFYVFCSSASVKSLMALGSRASTISSHFGVKLYVPIFDAGYQVRVMSSSNTFLKTTQHLSSGRKEQV